MLARFVEGEAFITSFFSVSYFFFWPIRQSQNAEIHTLVQLICSKVVYVSSLNQQEEKSITTCVKFIMCNNFQKYSKSPNQLLIQPACANLAIIISLNMRSCHVLSSLLNSKIQFDASLWLLKFWSHKKSIVNCSRWSA